MAELEDVLRQRGVREQMRGLQKVLYVLERFPTSALIEHVTSAELKEIVLSKLGDLPGCTLDDVRDMWQISCAGKEEADFDSAYEQFCTSLVGASGRRWRSEPLALTPSGPFETTQYPHTETLWQSGDGKYGVEVLATLPAGREIFRDAPEPEAPERELEETCCHILVCIRGTCTERFFGIFCERVVFAISSLLDSILKLNSLWLRDCMLLGRLPADVSGQLDPDMGRRFTDGYRLWQGFGLATSDEEDTSFSPTLLFLRDSLNALLADPARKGDSIERRVKNAVGLLVEAKRQSHAAIGLALSVSAIEALLCRKGDNIAQMFSENMAVLLEPATEYRSAAERWCKRLYDKRSGILHGSDVACAETDVRNAEMASVAVLKAILERRAGVRRMGGDHDNPQVLLKEFKAGKYSAGQPMFVEETSLNRLWRGSGVADD